MQYKHLTDTLESRLTVTLSYSESVLWLSDVIINCLNKDTTSVKYLNSMLSSIDMNQLTEATYITPYQNSESLIGILLCNRNFITG